MVELPDWQLQYLIWKVYQHRRFVSTCRKMHMMCSHIHICGVINIYIDSFSICHAFSNCLDSADISLVVPHPLYTSLPAIEIHWMASVSKTQVNAWGEFGNIIVINEEESQTILGDLETCNLNRCFQQEYLTLY